MEDLSPRQLQVLNLIRSWVETNGIAPSFREIGDQLGIKSTNGVSDHVRALERKGYIERVGGRGAARSLRLTRKATGTLEDERVTSVPVLGRIAAGSPILAVEDPDDALMMDRDLLPTRGGEVFALVVRGDSMIEDGIHDGDYVFVHKQSNWSEGEIIAVLVEGEATVKRVFRERGGKLRLQPSNSDMDPIFVAPNVGECEVMGAVVGVYRRVH